MVRPHDPYEDPAVRRRHRKLVADAIAQAFFWPFLAVMVLGAIFLTLLGVSDGMSFTELAEDIPAMAFLAAILATPFVVVAAVIAGPAIRHLGRAFGPDYCRRCGYARKGLVGDVCPECGASFPEGVA